MTISEVSPLATVRLSGAGAGQVGFGPPSGTKWALRLASSEVSTATLQPQVAWYRGSPTGPIELLDQSFTGAKASTGKVGGALFYPGQWLWAVWSGGDANAIATLRAFGQQGGRSDPLLPAPLGEGADNSTSIIVGNELLIIGADGSQIHGYLSGGSAVLDFLPAAFAGHTLGASQFSTNRVAPNGPYTNITSPTLDGGHQSSIQLGGGDPAGNTDSFMTLAADNVRITTTGSVPFGGLQLVGETEVNDLLRIDDEVFLENQTPSGLSGYSMGRGHLATMYFTGGTAATSAGAGEVALAAWTGADDVRFVPNRIYAAVCSGGAFSSVASSNELAVVKLRSAVNSTVAQLLGTARVPVPTAGNVVTWERTFYIKNTTGANVDKTSLGLTVARTGAGTGNESLFGDATNFPLTVDIYDLGLAADSSLTNVAVAIT